MQHFRRECTTRHNTRSTMQKNMMLKIERFTELLAAVMFHRPELLKSSCHCHLFYFCMVASDSAVESLKRTDPLLSEKLQEIGHRYKESKGVQAEGDWQGIPCPHPEAVGI